MAQREHYDDQPHAMYDEMWIRVNARDAQTALDLAITAAANQVYSNRRGVTEARVEQLAAETLHGDLGWRDMTGDPGASTWAPGGGAWSALVGRVSRPDSRGRESYAHYAVMEMRLDGARPHLSPHATDDPDHWRGVARALDERDALAASSSPGEIEAPTGRAPRI